MGDFNAKHGSLGSEETGHYGTKLMDTLNSYNLFVVKSDNHTRYDSLRDKLDTIDHIIYLPVLLLTYLMLTLNLTYLLTNVQ